MDDEQRSKVMQELGDPPQVATVADLMEVPSTPQLNGRHSTRGRYGVNLAPVAEVLGRYGIDPAEKIGELLQRSVLSPQEESRLLSELLQYTRPKLKAMEIQVRPPELSDEQIDRRLEALLARRSATGV